MPQKLMASLSIPSVSHYSSIDEIISRLRASPLVDGVAEFGSWATSQAGDSSDYDLLILVKKLPARVFQMVTTINGRLADIVLVETETADALLTAHEPPQSRSFEALFVLKMQVVNILYDASERLYRVKQLVTGDIWRARQSERQADSDLHAIWFWQSFALLHLERMTRSQDPVHQLAIDMMLTGCLPGTWRGYFDIRGVPWEGEKAAMRY